MPRVFADASAAKLISDVAQGVLNSVHYSIAFWMYRTGTPAALRSMLALMDAAGGTPSGWYVQLTTGNLVQASFIFGTNDKQRVSSTAPTLNGWTHVLITHLNTGFANTDFTFYFNGKSEAGTAVTTGSGAAHDSTTATKLEVGAAAVLAQTAPPVNFGPIAIWSRPLSPAEALALAGGMHPLRFKEGLVELFDLDGSTIEEGYLAKLALIQGATNPINTGSVKPPVEVAIPSLYETRQNTRPRSNWRSRYIANAVAGGAVINDHNFRRVARGAGVGIMRGAA